MRPSFALSLSFDGIRLLHRAAGGWRVVGEVALDAADMAGELEVLRKTASALEPGGVRAKVLLPNEQIKFLTIDTPGMDDAARHAAAENALEGATPYAVSDLAFDISAEGEQTHIAAVAKETLAEAEAFAVEHRFHPVSFAAVPGDQAYLGEPFFGVTETAAELLGPDETVEPDGIAVVVIGDVDVPTGPVVAEDPAPVVDAVHEAPTTEDAELAEAIVDVAASEETVAPAHDPVAAERLAEDPEPEVSQEPTETEKPNVMPAMEAEKERPAPTVTEVPAPPPTVGFASRRTPDAAKTPELGGARRGPAAPVASTNPRPEPIPLTQTGSVTAGKIAVEPESPTFQHVAAAAEPPARSGFLSRRKTKTRVEPAAPKPTVISAPPAPVLAQSEGSEQDRMTIFGARKSDVGGKPRFLGLILTAALLVFLAGVAAWASVFLDDGLKLSRLFGEREPQVAASTLPPPVVVPQITQPEPEPDPGVVTASLSPALSEEDAAVLDALSEPVEPQTPVEPTEEELLAQYAATGIWPVAPQTPPEPAGLVNIDDLYLTSIDPVSTASDAIALPAVTVFDTDTVLAAVSSPPAAGTQFALDAAGLVIPTAAGALSPDGFTVYLGRPPLVPPTTPTRFQSEPQDTAIRSALAALRPQPRPQDLVENTERAQLDGLTRTELASFRPALRPQSLQQQAEAAAEVETPAVNTDAAVAAALATPSAVENATKFAVQASIRPDTRPRNFSRIVQRAQRNTDNQEVRVASAAAVAPRVVQPNIPSKASVAKQATVKNALNLRKINLIGVYGKPSNRRALVRLGNGRYKKVVVGDRIDGGRVSAIGEGELRYTKRGRDLVLKMPR